MDAAATQSPQLCKMPLPVPVYHEENLLVVAQKGRKKNHKKIHKPLSSVQAHLETVFVNSPYRTIRLRKANSCHSSGCLSQTGSSGSCSLLKSTSKTQPAAWQWISQRERWISHQREGGFLNLGKLDLTVTLGL